MRRCLLVSLVVMFCVTSMFSQGSAAPAIDSGELFAAALRFVDAVHQHSLTTGDPRKMQTIQYALQKEVGVSQADYVALVREAAAVRKATTVGNGKALTGVSRTTEFNQSQTRLKAELSPASWTGLQAFVNGPFKRATFAAPAR